MEGTSGHQGIMGNTCSSSNSSATSAQNGHTPRDKKQEQQTGQTSTEDAAGFPTTHSACRGGTYPRDDDVLRFPVPDDKVSWKVEYPDYDPFEFFAIHDVPLEEDKNFRTEDGDVHWNKIEGKINRQSFQGQYEIIDKLPRNPVGRTGICGRGRLARWGPNHAADPVVSRWKRDSETGDVLKHSRSGKPLLEFISIKRGDSGHWAIPGGFVDAGEEVFSALRREFGEEAMNSEEMTAEQKTAMHDKLDKLFGGGKEVYKGYVDDPRNTDNSWMETVAVSFHDDTGELVGQLNLQAGDDAVGVRWAEVSSDLDLYASHEDFVRKSAELLGAHW